MERRERQRGRDRENSLERVGEEKEGQSGGWA